jgi:hypothetical protein
VGAEGGGQGGFDDSCDEKLFAWQDEMGEGAGSADSRL